MPVYLVTVNPTEPYTRLINAKTKAGAIAFVIDDAVTAEVPTPQRLLELGKAGVAIEETTRTAPEPAPKEAERAALKAAAE